MSLQSRLRTVLCCAVLETGALLGVPMRPEQVRALMHALNQPTLAQTEPDRNDPGDDPERREGASSGMQALRRPPAPQT